MVADLERFAQRVRAERGGFFDRDRSITLVRAPGWVDLFGGLVAEAGMLSLLWPTGGGVMVALQPDPEPVIRFRLETRIDSIPCTALFLHSGPREYEDVVAEIDRYQPPRSPWWGPALMAWVALMREEFVRFGGGARVMLQFNPNLPGLAAAVIAAVAQALVTAYGVHLSPRELAITCAEGLVRFDRRGGELIGAFATVCAAANEVLAVWPHRAQLMGSVHLPAGYAIWTIRVGDEPRQPLMRVHAAFAKIDRLLAEEATEPGAALVAMGLNDFLRGGRQRLSATDSAGEGAGSLAALAMFALEEQQRGRIALALLRAATHRTQREDDVRLIGELLTQSHWSQAVLGLTDPHADALAERLVAPAIFGVRQPVSTSRATLVVFGRSDAEAEVQRVVAAYRAARGLPVSVTGGSLAGVHKSGARNG